jgi:hypothetical protein
MQVAYDTIEGTDYEWIHEEIQKTLAWVSDAEIGHEFWGRVQTDLSKMWMRLSVALINCKTPIYGFRYLVTNSSLTVYPQV